jgi:uncharacterized protein
VKQSKYNILQKEGENFVVYNQLWRNISIIDEELYNSLIKNDLSSISCDVSSELRNEGYLCNDDLHEEYILLYRNRRFRYTSNYARITIIPTLNCNFSCWYCYESHFKSKMTPKGIKSAIIFCKDVISRNNIKTFHLDWFGGEPLLYFNEIIKPISLTLKDFCKQENVVFFNSITTNGYLISSDMIEDIKKIELKTFQITLDGSPYYHNKTRFTDKDNDTYHKIIKNISILCNNIKDIEMSLRINYTPANIKTLELIADDFSSDIRNKIKVIPQLVWQFKSGNNPVFGLINEKLKLFKEKGYKTMSSIALPSYCYVERINQFVINYDLSLYKCTARDFKNKDFSIGSIDRKGKFTPTNRFFDYFDSSQIETKECLECNFLPSCLGSCLQKRIEGSHVCNKREIEKSINYRIKTLFFRYYK